MEPTENTSSLPGPTEVANFSLLPSPSDNTEHHYPAWFVVTLSALMVLFIVCSLVGNTLVIVTILRHRAMRTRTNLFLMNLAVADVMVALLDMPVALVTLIAGRWVFGDLLCQLNAFFVGLGTMTSVHTLMHISIHKYISMTRPFSRFMTRQKILALIAAAWLWCIGYNLTPWMGLTHTVYKRGTTQCGPEIPHTVQQRIHSGINSLINLYLPLGVMIFCYFRIFQEIRAHLGRMRENSNMAQRSSVLQQQRIAVTLFLVLACFLLCMAPYMVYSNLLAVSRAGHDSTRVPLILNPISYWFLYLSSVLNPIIYGARSSTFRQSYREILCGAKRTKILTVGSIRSVGSTRLYSQRLSAAPASSPCESQVTQSTQSTQSAAAPSRWLQVPPHALHAPKAPHESQDATSDSAACVLTAVSCVSHAAQMSHVSQAAAERQRY